MSKTGIMMILGVVNGVLTGVHFASPSPRPIIAGWLVFNMWWIAANTIGVIEGTKRNDGLPK